MSKDRLKGTLKGTLTYIVTGEGRRAGIWISNDGEHTQLYLERPFEDGDEEITTNSIRIGVEDNKNKARIGVSVEVLVALRQLIDSVILKTN